MKIILPFVSVLDHQPEDCRFPVTVRSTPQKGYTCERDDEGNCSDDEITLGDCDDNSPFFCLKHFHELHFGQNKQSHIEPMNEEELPLL
jgi:hypothetical protein